MSVICLTNYLLLSLTLSWVALTLSIHRFFFLRLILMEKTDYSCFGKKHDAFYDFFMDFIRRLLYFYRKFMDNIPNSYFPIAANQ